MPRDVSFPTMTANTYSLEKVVTLDNLARRTFANHISWGHHGFTFWGTQEGCQKEVSNFVAF